MNLAPIAISTYSRIQHLKTTVDALARNELADQSELFFLSDAPKPGDEEKVAQTRKFLRSVTGFNNVTVIERKTNDRVFNSRDGIRQLLDSHGKVIFMEEDIVTEPSYLNFVNQGLDFYERRDDIFAICGYTPPIEIPKEYSKDIILCPRFSAWGCGLWKDQYDKIIFDKNEYLALLNDPYRLRRFRSNGEDLPRMLRKVAYDKIDALDVRIFFTQFVRNQHVICPTRSLVNNTGFDGTGIHCGNSVKFNVRLARAARNFQFDLDIAPNEEINRRLYLFRSDLPDAMLARLIKQHLTNPVKRLLSSVKNLVLPLIGFPTPASLRQHRDSA